MKIPSMSGLATGLAAFSLLAACAIGNAKDTRRDHDNNPPGPAGGPGTNWENPPGPRGGPGASPDRRWARINGTRYEFVLRTDGFYFNENYGYWHPNYGFWNQAGHCWWDNDNNPPGPRGGPGTNWENPPGPQGGPGASPNRYGHCK